MHLQWLRRIDGALWLCAGSAGLAYGREQPAEKFVLDAWGEYAIVSYAHGSIGVEFRRVPFDRERVVAAILAADMPERLAFDLVARWRRR